MGEHLKLELTEGEINQILFTLAEKPYKEVFELIARIREQANKQISIDS